MFDVPTLKPTLRVVLANCGSPGRRAPFPRVRSTTVGSSKSVQAGGWHRAGLAGLWRVAIALPVAGCSYAPTMDLLGSYFPGWMLCAVLGVVAAVIIRQILGITGVNEYVVAPLLTYAALAVSATLLIWLFWFGH